MTAEDVIKGFREGAPEDAERAAYANELFQEAIRLGMELNNQYHTPEEIREIMGRLTGKEIAPDLRLFPPRSIRTSGKISLLGGMCSSTPAVTSRTRAGLKLEMAR